MEQTDGDKHISCATKEDPLFRSIWCTLQWSYSTYLLVLLRTLKKKKKENKHVWGNSALPKQKNYPKSELKFKAVIFQEAQEYQANISHWTITLSPVTKIQSERESSRKDLIPFLTHVKVVQG